MFSRPPTSTKTASAKKSELRLRACHPSPRGPHSFEVGLAKRLWDLARANANDFTSELLGGDDTLTARERAALEQEVAESVGAKAGRHAREMKDRAEDAWDRAYDAAQRGSGPDAAAQELERWYRTLELEPGAPLEEIRRAYRTLVKRYHPDRYANDPAKYAAANEVVQRVTAAYDGLRAHLER